MGAIYLIGLMRLHMHESQSWKVGQPPAWIHLGYDDETYLISPYVASFWHYILIATCLFDDVIPEYFVCYFIPISYKPNMINLYVDFSETIHLYT